MKLCKHCNKVKSRHQPDTLFCPSKSRGLGASYVSNTVYDEYESDPVHAEIVKIKLQHALNEFDTEFYKTVEESGMSELQANNQRSHIHSQIRQHFSNWILPDLTKNAVLKVELNGVITEYDAEWIGNIVHEAEKALSDMYFNEGWDNNSVPVMTVTCIETGQVSLVTYFAENAELISTEELRDKSSLEDYEEINSTANVENNAILHIDWNNKTFKSDVQWVGQCVLGDIVEELFFSDKYEDEWSKGTYPNMIVIDNITGQSSRIRFADVTGELYSNEEHNDTINSTEEVSLSDLNIDDFVMPMQNKQWVLNNIHENSDADCDDEVQDLERALKECDGSIVLGKPDTANDGTYLMFGLKTNDGLLESDYCLLDNILFKKWIALENAGFIEIGTFESHIDIDESTNKGITTFMSEVIGRSLFGTELKDIKSTADCKAFLKSEYNVIKAKRTKKEKWGKIEYRIFEDDNGEEYTIVTYNDKLISHYAFAYNEDY